MSSQEVARPGANNRSSSPSMGTPWLLVLPGLMWGIILLALVASLVGVAVTPQAAVAAEGGEGAQVTATVTIQSISVTIAEGYPTAVGYGVMAPGTEATPVFYTPDTYVYLRVENNGSVAEDLLIKGADATCGAGTWTLAATPGADLYSHLYGIGQSPSSYSPLSTATSTLASGVAVGGTVDFNLKIQTPTSSTVYGEYSTAVTILAVAP